MRQPRLSLYLVVASLALWMLFETATGLAVDWLWFDALDYESIFRTKLTTRAGLWLLGLAVGIGFLGGNIRLAWRTATAGLTPGRLIPLEEVSLELGQVLGLARLLLTAAVAVLSLLFAGMMMSQWLVVLSFLHRREFGVVDPLFGLDIGFFVFELPVLDFVQRSFMVLIVLSLVGVVLIHVGREVLLGTGVLRVPPAARRQVLALGALLFAALGVGAWLSRFSLLFQQRGAVYGAGYADVTAQLPALWFVVAVSLAGTLVLVASLFRRGWKLPLVAVGTYLVSVVLVSQIYPELVQDYRVGPNELQLERQYLDRNIEATRKAFALDRIEVRPFDVCEADDSSCERLTRDTLADNPLTINNVRIWDTRPLLTTYRQLQEIRLYYDFSGIDVDRYVLDGELRQVMLAPRELNYGSVPDDAQSWVNEHFQYTHGYGLTLSPVNVVTDEGLPDLWVKDIPPQTTFDLKIDRPEIYYGERTDRWVLVRTAIDEFDYPLGDQNKYGRYDGAGGIPVGDFSSKLLFSLYFNEIDLLLADDLQPDSRLLMRRTIEERARTLTDFLDFDDDPYMVIADGRLFWIQDAYTTSRLYPYSAPVSRRGRGKINYMRNSVKVVVDAYNGDVTYYLADETDPLIAVYADIFPGVFRPLDQMAPALRAHIRYPSDFFDVQAEQFRAYHMTDANVFYNKEDMWELPREMYGNQEQDMKSYYLIMKLPGAEDPEFINLLPFVPTGKDNMISWMAARSDEPHYGKLILYQFPKQKLIFGPLQVEARIDQDPEISEQITLWGQAGSSVVRGNLLVIPIGSSLLYVEPLYLQAENGQLPELKRVIVSHENRIAMRPTLGEALDALFAGSRTHPPVEAAEGGGGAPELARQPGVAGDWRAQVGQANRLFEEAQAAQRAGNWALYGEKVTALEQVLSDLQATGDSPAGEDSGVQEESAPDP